MEAIMDEQNKEPQQEQEQPASIAAVREYYEKLLTEKLDKRPHGIC